LTPSECILAILPTGKDDRKAERNACFLFILSTEHFKKKRKEKKISYVPLSEAFNLKKFIFHNKIANRY